LNFNAEGAAFDVRHKVEIRFVRDRDLGTPMKPLFMKAATGLKLLEGENGYYGVSQPTAEQHGESCLVGQQASPTRSKTSSAGSSPVTGRSRPGERSITLR